VNEAKSFDNKKKMKKIQKPKNKPDLEEEYTPEEDFL